MINWSLWTLTGRYVHERGKKPWTGAEVRLLFLKACADTVCLMLVTFAIYIGVFWRLLDTPRTPFSCADERLRNPLFQNTVGTKMLVFCTYFLPCITAAVGLLIAHPGIDKDTFAKLTTYSVYNNLDYTLWYWLMTLTLEVVKVNVGRLRPNFVAMCRPDKLSLCDADPAAVVSDYVCQSEYKYSRNSRASFPSGHSGASVFAFIFLVLFFNRRLIAARIPDNKLLGLFRTVVLSVSLLFTVFCCISRITDFWHYPTDVLAGALIGLLYSSFSFTVFRKPSSSI